MTLSANIEHSSCDTSFKTLQSKKNFISTNLAIFIFLAINISKWETNSQIHKRFHHYRAVLLFRGCRFCFQWIHIIQNINFKYWLQQQVNVLEELIYLEKPFHADEQHGTKLAISVLQLIIFPIFFLAFNLIYLNVWEILYSQMFYSYLMNEMKYQC